MSAASKIGVAFALVGAFGAGVGLGPDIRGDAGPSECTSEELRSLEYQTRLLESKNKQRKAKSEEEYRSNVFQSESYEPKK